MSKKLLLFFLIITTFGFSQQIEIGANLSYGITNIANSKITEGRAVIGDALWNFNEGASIIYYFGDRQEKATNGIHFEFVNSKRGSKSEKYSDSEYNFSSKSFNLNYRRAGRLFHSFGMYADIGFGYNILDNKNIYKGKTDELIAFEKVNENLAIKNNEVTFIFAIGVDRLILKDNFVVFFEINGDGGISKINENSGSYRTQSLGFTTGLRYIIKCKKGEK